MSEFFVDTAETLLAVAELHWRALNKAAQVAQDEYDTARRVYSAARSDSVAAQRDAVHYGGGAVPFIGE
jgi:hypothetical protein